MGRKSKSIENMGIEFYKNERLEDMGTLAHVTCHLHTDPKLMPTGAQGKLRSRRQEKRIAESGTSALASYCLS